MTTLLQKIYRNIGTRQLVSWQDGYISLNGTTRDYVAIEGTSKASFNATANLLPYTTLDMVLGTGPLPGDKDGYVLNLYSSDGYAASLAAEINAAWASHNVYFATHPPAKAIVKGGDQHLMICNQHYIKINAYPNRYHFEALGLPQSVVRDNEGSTVTPRTDGYMDFNLSPEFRNDAVSNSIPIPDGANTMALWSSIFHTTIDGSQTNSPALLLLWSNGIEGEPTDNSLIKYPSLSRIVNTTPSIYGPTLDPIYPTGIAYPPGYPSQDGYQLQNVMPLAEVAIPAGATAVRAAFVTQGYSTLASVPTVPPIYRLAVVFGAR